MLGFLWTIATMSDELELPSLALNKKSYWAVVSQPDDKAAVTASKYFPTWALWEMILQRKLSIAECLVSSLASILVKDTEKDLLLDEVTLSLAQSVSS